MFDVAALGELLIDFTPCGISPAGMRLFEQNPGGAPANVLCALSNLGLKTAFIGKVGQDMHGDFLRETLQSQKVCTTRLVQDSNVFTTLAFVELSESGERSFSFARKPGADTCLKIGELNVDIIKNTKVFHFGSLSLTDEPARSTTFSAWRRLSLPVRSFLMIPTIGRYSGTVERKQWYVCEACSLSSMLLKLVMRRLSCSQERNLLMMLQKSWLKAEFLAQWLL